MSMRFRDFVPEFKITLSDLMWTALVVSPIWLTLGLFSEDPVTIVAAVADAHGATLTTTARPTGGLCISGTFAAASGRVVEDEAEGEPLARPDRRYAMADGRG